jgi:hypothetical protein
MRSMSEAAKGIQSAPFCGTTHVSLFAKPAIAIAFGAFFLCAETCLHADSVLQFANRPPRWKEVRF